MASRSTKCSALFAALLVACGAPGDTSPGEISPSNPSRPDAAPRPDTLPSVSVDAGPARATFGELSPAKVSDLAQADFIVTDPAVTVLPDKTYPTVRQDQIAVGDLDGDGYLDLLVAPSVPDPPIDPLLPLQVWLNNGDGTFRDGTADLLAADARLVVTGLHAAPYLADFNGDGQLDVFIRAGARDDGGAVNELLLSGSDGLLHDASSSLPRTRQDNVTSAWVGDIDGDGCVDVAVATMAFAGPDGRGGVYFLFGDCQGRLYFSTDGLPTEIAEVTSGDVREPPIVSPGATTLADFDGDGQLDLAACGSPYPWSLASPNLWIYGNEDFTFVAGAAVQAYRADYLQCDSVAAGDIDGDGRPDLVVTFSGMEGDTHLQVLQNEGDFDLELTNATFGEFVDGGPNKVDLRDVNGDGRLDLVRVLGEESARTLAGGSSDSSAPFLKLGDGHGQFTTWAFTKGGIPATADDVMAAFPADAAPDPEHLGLPLVFDANGDGVADLVLLSPHFRDSVPHTVDRYRIYTILAPPR